MVLNLTKYQYVIIFIIRKDLNFMKRRIRFTSLILALTILLSVVGCTSIFADDDDYPRTESSYMNGYKMYGYSNLTAQDLSSSTYCENVSYQKRVCMIYYSFIDLLGERNIQPGNDTGYALNGFDTLDILLSDDGCRNFDGVFSDHYVKASAHMYWQASEFDDYTYLGYLAKNKPNYY